MASTDPGVDEHIGSLPEWQRLICERVRRIVRDAEPEIEETTKRRGQPYFVLEGNVCAPLATKDHANAFLYDGAIVPDPERVITGGHGNSTARQISISAGDGINEAALTEMLRQIVANNRAGGWRKLKRERR